jgi:hypothetical protein
VTPAVNGMVLHKTLAYDISDVVEKMIDELRVFFPPEGHLTGHHEYRTRRQQSPSTSSPSRANGMDPK